MCPLSVRSLLALVTILSLAAEAPLALAAPAPVGAALAGTNAASGVRQLLNARQNLERLDGGSSTAWGMQGVAGALGKALPLASVAGAACKTAAGCQRLARGLRAGDASMVKLGALDLAGGLAWGGWCVAGPAVPVVAIGLNLAREVYVHRDALQEAGRKLGDWWRSR